MLKKKETFANSDQELSDEILTALSAQEDNFIKLYPNPFKTDLIISYTLDMPSFVEVKITDIQGAMNEIIQKESEQEAGYHRYYFEGSNLKKGIYVVTVFVNNEKKAAFNTCSYYKNNDITWYSGTINKYSIRWCNIWPRAGIYSNWLEK